MSRSSKLYNSDLAPTPANKKNWGLCKWSIVTRNEKSFYKCFFCGHLHNYSPKGGFMWLNLNIRVGYMLKLSKRLEPV